MAGNRQLSKLIEKDVIGPSDVAFILGTVAHWTSSTRSPMRILTLTKRIAHRLKPAVTKRVANILVDAESLKVTNNTLQPGPAWVSGPAQGEVDRLLVEGW
jgi:hypothetical protein